MSIVMTGVKTQVEMRLNDDDDDNKVNKYLCSLHGEVPFLDKRGIQKSHPQKLTMHDMYSVWATMLKNCILKWGRGLISIKDCIKLIRAYTKMSKETLLTTIWKCTKMSRKMCRTSEKSKMRTQKWEEKQLYKNFKRQFKDIANKLTWKWICRETLSGKLGYSE